VPATPALPGDFRVNSAIVPALSIVGGLGAFGIILVGLIGIVRKPDPAKYKQVWLKLGFQVLFLAGFCGLGALGKYVMAPLVVFLAFRCWYELLRALETRYGPIATPSIVLVLGSIAPLAGLIGSFAGVLHTVFAGTWLAMSLPMLITRRPPPLHGILGAAFAMFFVSAPLGLLLNLSFENYAAFAFFILLLMSHDALAEGFGRLLGKTPLWPDISPGKTLGGTLGGVVSCLVLGYVLNQALHLNWATAHVLAVSAGVVLMAAIGDLIASSIKREAGIKDFGKILPAHGGVLDRIDSLLFTLPFFFAAVRMLGGPD